MTHDELFSLYREQCIGAYTDYVALTLEKPEQIYEQLMHVLSHLAQTTNPALSPKEHSENMVKSHHHVQRAILDLNKLIWAELHERLDRYGKDPKFSICFNVPVKEVLQRYTDFHESGRSAREFELKNVGHDVEGSISRYKAANKIGYELYKLRDGDKIERVLKISQWARFNTFFMGVLASVVAGIILWFLPPVNKFFGKGSAEFYTPKSDNAVIIESNKAIKKSEKAPVPNDNTRKTPEESASKPKP